MVIALPRGSHVLELERKPARLLRVHAEFVRHKMETMEKKVRSQQRIWLVINTYAIGSYPMRY